MLSKHISFNNCLNQGNLPLPYLQSVLEVYDSVLRKSANYSGDAAIKAKQEIIHGLGNKLSLLIKALLLGSSVLSLNNLLLYCIMTRWFLIY